MTQTGAKILGMQVYSWEEIPVDRLSDAICRKVIHAGRITVARLYLAQGAIVPRHSHENEQISTIEKGRLVFRFDGGREVSVGAGQTLVIAPNDPHSAEALEETVAVDLFAPIREDWIRGDDAYLRTSMGGTPRSQA
jgi:quercetin dioxygenase-like cupin family protein